MRDDEYRKLRRALEEQREADLELIRAGYRAKLHALDMLWERPPASEERALPAAPATQPTAETRKPSETRGPAAPETVTHTIVINSVQEEIEKVLPHLPEVFDKTDIVRTFGWVPHRATLHRALATLQEEKKIALHSRSLGRHPARYRKIGSSPQEE
jgi:leucyl aminopeptidase (aminopeptidase T)